MSVLGSADKLVAQHRVGANGRSVLAVPNRFVEPGKKELVFNPLYAFPAGMDLSKLRFDFQFDVGDETKYKVETVVQPKSYLNKARLSLPIAGPALVQDGHDFYGRHRRLPLLDPMAQALGWRSNFMRSSYDFVITAAQKVPRADYIAIMNHDLEFAPGSTGHYNSSGYTLLGWVIEK